jgi:hypothetical protein
MSTIQPSSADGRPDLDFGFVFKKAGGVFVDDVVPLVLATLIVTVLSIVTLGVLIGPLVAGLCGMVITRVRDGKSPQVGDVFSCMDRFWSFLGAFIVLLLTIGLASITIIGGVLLAAIWLYVFPLMVDRRMGVFEAMGASKDVVVRGGFWQHLVLVILLLAIGTIGHGPLALLTFPFSVAVVLVSYLALEKRIDAGQAASATAQ